MATERKPETTPLITTPREVWRHIQRAKCDGHRVGIVPTMGALHEGHLRLVDCCKEHADLTVVTIFVNPTQFGPGEDFERYPRNLQQDCELLTARGADLIFAPTSSSMYPPGHTTRVLPPEIALPLEGQLRPNHFAGVCTIVLKLLNIIPADVACFGQKDYQQYLVVRQMAADLDLPVKVLLVPTVRDADGLALSSRNQYLSATERQQAVGISRALQMADRLHRTGQRDVHVLCDAMRQVLSQHGIEQIDYAAVADAQTLNQLTEVQDSAVALVAARVGQTRLIDNCLLP